MAKRRESQITLRKRLETLLLRRERLYRELSALGDFRRGRVSVNFRKCGKPGCRCARPDARGHLQYLWNATIDGKSHARSLRLGPELEKLGRELETYRAFNRLCTELVKVNEEICERRGVEPVVDASARRKLEKKLRRQFQLGWPRLRR